MAFNPYPKDDDFKFLAPNKEDLLKLQATPYDGKVDTWIPDLKEGYVKAKIVSTKGDKVTVKTVDKGETKELKQDLLQQMNPSKFEKNIDMANLTYLNEASVLYNLRSRYVAKMIYTYSGLFCIAINPYARLPIYTPNVVSKYRGKKRTEMPPHLFAVADQAYQNMVRDRENQSCLITGESGAGKTENTKKVIAYFAMVAAAQAGESEASGKKSECAGLEDQIVATNPVLEAYGNAKTVRNNNSSRFGKFIRIHFGPDGKIGGADIETYLLEKSRITYQMPGIERNYHIFYWLLSGHFPDYAAKFLVETDPAKYSYINQGCLTVDGMNDKEEMMLADQGFDDLGFPENEKFAMYQIVGAVLWFGEMKFKQRPREEQAEADGIAEAEKVAKLLGINVDDLINNLSKPKVKVGTEVVTKGQTLDQVLFSVQALTKCMYAKAFTWLVARVNRTLSTKAKRVYFIGVLDIAGFEIFEFNTFEQLCINYTNERLQQFFNHFMFVLEQEEYKKEGIVWKFVDFGMNLQRTVDLIEKKMGILSILEEECMFPKADDKSFTAKLYDQHLGKNESFGKPKPSKKRKYEAHFELYHYAGTVEYNITGWLNKNKDPINDCVMAMMAASKDPMVALFFFDPDAAEGGGAGKKKKGGGAAQTISFQHRESLNKLMDILHHTTPSFVRCIIPNEIKSGAVLDAALVLHQLRCNGVMEGIRICRLGFPSRMIYAEFKQRYSILAPNAIPAGAFVDGKIVTEKVLKAIPLDENDYRIGGTKVFFRAGVLGNLEDIRDERLTKITSLFQAHIRGYMCRMNYGKMQRQRTALIVVQRNIRKWLKMKDWVWFSLWCKVKPLLKSSRGEDEMAAAAAEFEKLKVEYAKLEEVKKVMEDKNFDLERAKEKMFIQLSSSEESKGDTQARLDDLQGQKSAHDKIIKDLETRLDGIESTGEVLDAAQTELETKIDKCTASIKELEVVREVADSEKQQKDSKIKSLNDEMARQDETIAKFSKEKRALDENFKKTLEDLAAEEDKCNYLNKLRQKLESSIDDFSNNLEQEKKVRTTVDKARFKIESELKGAQETVDDLSRIKSELEAAGKKKDQEINDMVAKLEDEQSLVVQLQKKIKELLVRIDELDEELEAERAARSKAEKQRNELTRELDELGQQVDEAGGATAAQMDINKKREAEIQKLRRDLEDAQRSSEANIGDLRKKQQDTATDLSEQLDNLNKLKQKVEKERNILKSEVDDIQGSLLQVQKQKSSADKFIKSLESQLRDVNARLDDSVRRCQEFELSKVHADQEGSDLTRQLEESESQANQLNKQRAAFAKQLEEAKSSLEDESRQRSKLSAEYRNFQNEFVTLKDQLDEEQEARGDLQRLVAKANSEAAVFRQKCESGEGAVNTELMEDLKRKLSAKLADAESQMEAAQNKCSSLEKAKYRLQGELEDLMIECERSQAIASQAEKRQRAFDIAIDDWKRKVGGLQSDLERSSGEARSNASEVYKMKSRVDESVESVDALRRENKNLADEIRDITDQLNEGGRSVHELEKSRKRLEMEKDELQSALEEAEATLESEEAKSQRATVEIAAIRQEIERRLNEKEEEFDSTRKNHQRAIDNMQATLEAEVRGKSDALRSKKKLESDINELEVALDGANFGRGEAEKNVKKFQSQIRDLQQALEDLSRQRDQVREQYTTAERRSMVLAGEIEELRTTLESTERTRKSAEGDLREASDRVSELSTQASSLSAAKRKLETDCQSMQVDLEEQGNEVKSAEERAKRAMTDASRLADELRQVQDHASQVEKARRTYESQVKELQIRLDEAEASALKGGKRIIQKLEQRCRELEVELDNEQRRHAETSKNVRKQDKRVKELAYQADEDRNTGGKLAEMIDKLQQKIKIYKRQVEESEEIAAINLAKYRKVTQEVQEAEERADLAENTLAKLRARNRGAASQEFC